MDSGGPGPFGMLIDEKPIRMGLWYTANGFGIALGGLLGFGIGHIKGALPSWKYEFLIIGNIFRHVHAI